MALIKKILIANRGEIAVRIIRACKEMNIPTVAVFSQADRDALHVQLADEAVCIGPPNSRDSYMDMQAMLCACQITGADALHPGFGFLSESSLFAKVCEQIGVTFIGPSSQIIAKMGDKAQAKITMDMAGVPTIPGSKGTVKDKLDAQKQAEIIGYPVMIKASAGGGGRGIRIVKNADEMPSQFDAASSEAKACFGDPSIYIEKYLENPHHIEVQILADKFGNVVHLGERDCSIQRRNQKVIEESPSPSPIITPKLRAKMGESAKKAAKFVGYSNAGTVEFLVDASGNFYFMEMNTRIQVEHPVTEMISGIDLVKWQIRIAAGEALTFDQESISFGGHAIECRINAENPKVNFCPCPGMINKIHFPGGPGIRIETAVKAGQAITPYYDSMIAKVIAYGDTRQEALGRMKRALDEITIDGVNTNLEFQRKLLDNNNVENGIYNTGLLATANIFS